MSAYCTYDELKFLDCDHWKTVCYRLFNDNYHNPNLRSLFYIGQETIPEEEAGKISFECFKHDFTIQSYLVAKHSKAITLSDMWDHPDPTPYKSETYGITFDTSVDSDSSDDDSVIEIQNLLRSASLTSISSAMRVAGILDLPTSILPLAPKVSETSLQEKRNGNVEQIYSEDKHFNFTRDELKKRLQNLVKLSDKSSNRDPEVNSLKLFLTIYVTISRLPTVGLTGQQDLKVCIEIPSSFLNILNRREEKNASIAPVTRCSLKWKFTENKYNSHHPFRTSTC